jgi:hypothetical protein
MKRTDFQCVVNYVYKSIFESLYEVLAESTDPIDREEVRKDLISVFNFLNEAKQHGFEIPSPYYYEWEDIKNECVQ